VKIIISSNPEALKSENPPASPANKPESISEDHHLFQSRSPEV
jgi:hypothetical protein